MNVILREDIAGVGRRGDIVTVADGHARNYLLPRGLAFVATDGAVAQANAMRRRRDLRESADRESARTVAEALTAKTFTIKAKAGNEGRLFGSVTTSDIAGALAAQAGVTLDRKKVVSQPIRTTGNHTAVVRLHADVECTIKINVVG
ncbi:MAG: ribosomal protein [Actinomycetota bacterium]|jgi:large subunit ribosomal protein L9|nr:50S ribosomal protein L9 [Actinomycetota bacterium]NBR66836.1 50S ribosomal protein L9 [Actinomycetota bacterium]